MKKVFSIVCLMLASVAMMAETYTESFSISDFSVAPGEKKVMELQLTNVLSATAFQMDFVLPDGFTMDGEDEDLDVGRTTLKKHNIAGNYQSTGAFRVMVNSQTNKLFDGNSGTVAYIPVKVASTVTPGTYQIKATEVKLACFDAENKQVNEVHNDFTITVTVTGTSSIALNKAEVKSAQIVKVADANGITIITENHDYGVEGVVK